MKKKLFCYAGLLILGLSLSYDTAAQSTAFTYQGSLNTSGTPANGNHDFEFAMFNGGGVQIGVTLTRSNVSLTGGLFAVELDFGNQFQGADRFLEIRVRPSSGGAFITLAPRQLITSAPHAIRSLDAAQLGGVAANQYVLSGASSINAAAQFNIGGSRVLSVPGNGNTFVGINTGTVNSGSRNSFFGNGAGAANTFSLDNSFFGFIAGGNNTSGSANAFFGSNAGGANTTGSNNTFLGGGSGSLNTTGTRNVFVGTNSGTVNTTGDDNVYVGYNAGAAATTGLFNTFVGKSAGELNTTGQANSFFGTFAGGKTTTGNFNSFFGRGAGSNNTTGFNNSFFGDGAGTNNTTGTDNAFFGNGSGLLNTGSRNSFFGNGSGAQSTTGIDNSFFGHQAGGFNGAGSNNSFFGSNTGLFNTGNRNSFFGQRAGQDNTIGSDNSFFGNLTGENNTTGNRNSFFGTSAGAANTTGGDNTFIGNSAGAANTTGNGNAFFGAFSGQANTIGGSNNFFGSGAGASNTTGFGNAFFGTNAGNQNTSASDNSFFGRGTGGANTTGTNNSFFGANSGILSTTGSNNSFFGTNSGFDNTIGTSNSFFGTRAGDNNTSGSSNSFFGADAGDGNVIGSGNSYFGANSNSSDGLSNAAAIGSRAYVTQSNSIILGSINGINGSTTDTTVGIGTTAPARRLHVSNGVSGAVSISTSELVIEDDAAAFQHFITPNDVESGILFGDPTDSIGGGIVFNNAATNNGMLFRTGGNTNRMTLDGSGNLGIGTVAPLDRLEVNGIIRVATLGAAGATALCRNASNQISTCSSSMRYKSNVNPFSNGLSLIKRLRPVSFNWRDGGMLDLGLVAEDVAAVEPLLTTTNDKGEVEGVKYDRIGVILINAVKEQQAQIESQQKQIDAINRTSSVLRDKLAEQIEANKQLTAQIEAIRMLLCTSPPNAGICKKKDQGNEKYRHIDRSHEINALRPHP